MTTKILTEHPDIDAIFCANDSMALGATQAIDLLGIPKKILVAGYDNIELVRTEIRNGRIQATIEQHPELMGEYGVDLAWKKLNGNKIPFYQPTPLDLITYEHFGKRIAFSISTLQNSFFSIMMASANETATLFGMELIPLDAQNQDTQQLTHIVDILAQNIDILIVNPTNTESITPAIEHAQNMHMPVISVDRKVSPESARNILCHIETDNAQGGRLAAAFIAQRLGKKGRIAEFEGIPGTSATHERGAGFNKELSKFKQMGIAAREVGNFDRKNAKSEALRVIRKAGPFDGIFAHNDNMILGVIDAYEELGIQLPGVLVGFDAVPEAIRSIEQGKLTATIAQNPKTMGKLAIETVAKYFRGEKLPTVKRFGSH